MKKVCIILALMLLVGCVPVAVTPPTETAESPLPPTEMTEPPLVALPAGNLPDAPYTPLAAPVRFYREAVHDVIPNTGYGRIFPYVGKAKVIGNGYLGKYGLCTEKGVIVCDLGYDSYSVYGDATSGMYALRKHQARVLGLGVSEWKTTFAAFDGSWVLETQDERECQYGATVKVNGLWGVWGYDGQWVLPPTYEYPLYFECGLAPVVSDDRKTYYYIDITEQPVLGPYSAETEYLLDFRWCERIVSEDGKTYGYFDKKIDPLQPVLGPYDIDYMPWDILLDTFLRARRFGNQSRDNAPCYLADYYHGDTRGYLTPKGDFIDEWRWYLSVDPEIFYYYAADTAESDDNIELVINGVAKIYSESPSVRYTADGGGRIIIEHSFELGSTVLDLAGKRVFSIPRGELSNGGGYYFVHDHNDDTEIRIVYDVHFNELFRTEGMKISYIGSLGPWIEYGVGERHNYYYYKHGILDERGGVLLPAIYDNLTVVNGMLIALCGTRSHLFDKNLNCVLELDITDGG